MEIRVRPMEERDLPEVDRIVRLAFGTFLGLRDPMKMFGDSDFAYTRFRAAPDSALTAVADGKVAGSNFVTRWGSFGFFGPLSVDPQLWEQKVAQQLLVSTMDLFDQWGCRHTGLFTFSHSPKHAALYQKFDFWSRFLTPVMSKQIEPPTVATSTTQHSYARFSELPAAQKEEILAACRQLTGQIYDGLDVSRETLAVESQRLGDTILLLDGSKLLAFAVCHVGAKTEAGSDTCYVKFAAVRPDASAHGNFEKLLDVCEAYTSARGMSRLTAGVNMGRHEAYKVMVRRGYRTDMMGVAMQRASDPGFNQPGIYVLDDWR
jgi:GNAT superfamily N-acetyltransferase